MRRWEVWRKYEHFCKVYDNLCSKYANHKIAKLPSLDRIKKTWKNIGISGGSNPGLVETTPSTEEEEEIMDDAIFLGHSFLQKLQVKLDI